WLFMSSFGSGLIDTSYDTREVSSIRRPITDSLRLGLAHTGRLPGARPLAGKLRIPCIHSLSRWIWLRFSRCDELGVASTQGAPLDRAHRRARVPPGRKRPASPDHERRSGCR